MFPGQVFLEIKIIYFVFGLHTVSPQSSSFLGACSRIESQKACKVVLL